MQLNDSIATKPTEKSLYVVNVCTNCTMATIETVVFCTICKTLASVASLSMAHRRFKSQISLQFWDKMTFHPLLGQFDGNFPSLCPTSRLFTLLELEMCLM